jgi:hypothetical protein
MKKGLNLSGGFIDDYTRSDLMGLRGKIDIWTFK